MVPGLALFYGGMVRSKNVLNMLNMNTYCLGIVPLVWVLVAFSLGNNGDGDGLEAFIGNLDALGLTDVELARQVRQAFFGAEAEDLPAADLLMGVHYSFRRGFVLH